LARGRFEQESARRVASDGLDDVNEVFFDPAFGKTEHLRELKGRQSGPGDQLHDALPWGQDLFIAHKESYAVSARNERAPCV
jgi:hypothetical protein